jgi:hypothetical protein
MEDQKHFWRRRGWDCHSSACQTAFIRVKVFLTNNRR